MESAVWVFTYVHHSEACLAHSSTIPAQLALLPPPCCHLVVCDSRRRPSCHSHEPWAGILPCPTLSQLPRSSPSVGSRRLEKRFGPQGRRSSSCRHQVPLTAVVLRTCPSRLWLATPVGFPEAKWQRICLLKHRWERRRELPRGHSLKATPRLPPDARRRHKPPSKGAILEPKWLPDLSLSRSRWRSFVCRTCLLISRSIPDVRLNGSAFVVPAIRRFSLPPLSVLALCPSYLRCAILLPSTS